MKRTHAWSIVALSLIITVLLLWAFYLFWGLRTTPSTPQVDSFETCAAAGNAVMESYPRQCRDAKTGVLYVERMANGDTNQPATRNFTSTKGVTIQLDYWTDAMTITSPLTITGKVPGSWSFEGSFPVILKDGAGNTLAQGPAKLQGDWMTDELVAFTVTLQFTKPASPNGTLILQKDNPSGLAKNEDSLTVTVRY